MVRLSSRLRPLPALVFFVLTAAAASAQPAPLDALWTPERLQKIRDRSTLNLQIVPRTGYYEVFYDSEAGDAKWADSGPPYAVHTGGTIRIHGYLAAPAGPAPRPALVVGHGHGGHGDPDVPRALAALGYGAFSIDGPRSGLSTGGPEDTEQAWISVEEQANSPSPDVSFLYHWAYAGMRALTVLEALATIPGNPLHIDASRLGIVGASMGGQLTYYVNGIDDRVKAAVGIAVAGDWRNVMQYEGAWLYHGLYYYTRDGMPSGQDALNAIAGCDDPTLQTFLDYFDPIRYAPTQHGPLLTIVGSHDQYFVAPGINTTFDAVESAGTSDRFIKRLFIAPNGKHGVVDGPDAVSTILTLIGTIDGWLKYAFEAGPVPVQTPTLTTAAGGSWMAFRVATTAGAAPVLGIRLHVASQMDSVPDLACDFATVPTFRLGSDFYGFVPIGQAMPCGPPLTPANVVYFASATDTAGYTASSKLHYRGSEMAFGQGFVPRIEHWRGDDFPVPPAPVCGGVGLPPLSATASWSHASSRSRN
ncbi:MAG TPA: PhoPQ-activated protein PqaA family protein [Vicinamibacterales bacterium]|nr:PhoPQ-activated protein PqaA family protein [Vicinamibacterales bacterium]